jgi:hypothetical protein
MKLSNNVALFAVSVCVAGSHAFAPHHTQSCSSSSSTTALGMGLFDNKGAGGSGNSKSDLDDQWKAQQEMLNLRRAPKKDRDKYFAKVEKTREEATKKQNDMWSWQTKNYKTGEDPIDEWKKRRASGQISDLEDQYGDPKKMGGIPLPMASFGVGGEFGVGGKFDNGGRFDLRLPYADQGYVDEDSDVMSKLSGMFGGKKKEAPKQAKNAAKNTAKNTAKKEEPPKKKNNWPW